MLKLAILIALVLLPHQSNANSFDGACAQIIKNMNILVDFTRTSCHAGPHGVESSILISADKNVMAVPASQKAYLLAIAGVAGKILQDQTYDEIKLVAVVDTHLAQKNEYILVRAEILQGLQTAIYNGHSTLDQMYAGILAAAETRTFR